MSEQDTILFLHDPKLDPTPFLTRLLPDAEADDDSPNSLTWVIDNKYYTATVTVRAVSLEAPIPHAPAVVYLFTGTPPHPLPPQLTRLSVSDPPPDIFLSVCESGRISDSDDERFAELGIDVVNEQGEDDDDEKPLDPLESIRQTLQTHMWPGMKRKPISRTRAVTPPSPTSPTLPSPFPVTFDSAALSLPTGQSSDFDAGLPSSPRDDGYAAVPDEFGDFASAEHTRAPDEFGEFASAEYARLDAWLDDDDVPNTNASEGFEDDFGPAPSGVNEEGEVAAERLDPTPILLHLQAVRAELSLVEDEDERRVRAGEEVAKVIRGLGLGEVDFGEWDDEM